MAGWFERGGNKSWLVRALVFALSVPAFAIGCKCSTHEPTAASTSDPNASESVEPTATAPGPESTPPAAPRPPVTLVGATIARSPDSAYLYVADEVNSQVHRVGLPLSETATFESVKLPGPPAQLVATAEQLFVTIRNPPQLWVGSFDSATPPADESDAFVHSIYSVALPDDAFGLALTATQRAVVSSAWTGLVSLVDLPERRVVWSVSVAREPRGVVVTQEPPAAYVTHLVGSHLTRLALTEDESPTTDRVTLPAAPLRAPGEPLAASLGYSAALSPDGNRYFVARHALGAQGKNAWFGAATVDVLDLPSRTPLAPSPPHPPRFAKAELTEQLISGGDTQFPGSSPTPFTQPRHVIYRAATDTLLVAGEGDDRVTELDALALDPSMAVVATYEVGAEYHPTYHVAKQCAAPSGLVLSEDEQRLWVYCAATNDVVEVALHRDPFAAASIDPVAATAPSHGAPSDNVPAGAAGVTTGATLGTAANGAATNGVGSNSVAPNTGAATSTEFVGVVARRHLLDDPLGPGGATGRKLFYSALDFPTSGGLGCAGCHPEGRDDGHVWHEATFTTEDGTKTNFVGHASNVPPEAHTRGYARRTPMLAGRVSAAGPYGWHAESPTVTARLLAGFELHRWGALPETSPAELEKRARVLVEFLRRGLVPPRRETRALTPLERQGKQLFESPGVGCAVCHPPQSGLTTRRPYRLTPPLPLAAGFDADPDSRYKIPDLRYLARRAPYFHDGSAQSLEQLLEENKYRMGTTAHLSVDERRALQAYLETL